MRLGAATFIACARLVTSFTVISEISADHGQVLGIEFRPGRLLAEKEVLLRAPLAVVGEALAEILWPDGNVIGQRLRIESEAEGPWMTAVGVVPDIGRADLYVPYTLRRTPTRSISRPSARSWRRSMSP